MTPHSPVDLPARLTGQHNTRRRLDVLDGWRGASILCVLAAHLLPLGPSRWQLNEAAGQFGMAIFFTLSGFLITKFLLEHDSLPDFIIRRLFRIVPLAWLTILIVFPLVDVDSSTYLSNLLFYANLPPQHLLSINAHFWSLGVEVQFYMGIALLVALAGKRGLMLIPLLCVAVTINRWRDLAYADIVTWRRVDEILAGGVLALAYAGRLGTALPRLLSRANIYVMLALLVVSSLPTAGFMNYLRPYFAATCVGVTLLGAPSRWASLMRNKRLAYIAEVSFALYVIHNVLANTWLGSGDTLVKYAKRPLLFAMTFGLAHLSTFYFEHPCIEAGKRLSKRLGFRKTVVANHPLPQK